MSKDTEVWSYAGTFRGESFGSVVTGGPEGEKWRLKQEQVAVS